MVPEVKYANSDSVSIAYQVFGQEKPCLVTVLGWVSNIEEAWKNPWMVNWYNKLASFSKVINFDKRGVGLSDRVSQEHLPGIDKRMDDLRAILDAEGIEKAFIFGVSEGGPLAALFAATYPKRCLGLMIYGSYPKWVNEDGYEHGWSRSGHEKSMKKVQQEWGKAVALDLFAPSVADDPMAMKQWTSYLRQSASPGSAIALYKMNMEIDIREILPSIKVPTLILHRKDDKLITVDNARYFAYNIQGAKLIELEGADHLAWHGDIQQLTDPIEAFVTNTNIKEVKQVSSFKALVLMSCKTVSESLKTSLAKGGGRIIFTENNICLAIFKGAEKALRWACIWQSSKESGAFTALIDVQEIDVENNAAEKVVLNLKEKLKTGKVLTTETTHNIVIDPSFIIQPLEDSNLYDVKLTGLKEQNKSVVRNEDVEVLLEVRRYLNDNYNEAITLKTLVKIFRLNDFKLKTGFKQLFGTTFRKYLDNKRMHQACELLKSSDLSIQVIADEVGYGHYTNFILAFKRHFNQTPLQYRKENAISLIV